MKNLAIIQARTGSTRLPKKVLLDLSGKTVLERVIERAKKSHYIDQVIVATTINPEDLPIVLLCASKGIQVFCGSEKDVLDRYYQAAKLVKPDNVIRITADCPLLDPEILDKVVRIHIETSADYTSNTIIPSYPDGLDCEIMTYEALKEAWLHAELASQREHVTQYIIHNDKYKKQSVENTVNCGNERWTIDTREDYNLISSIYSEFCGESKVFGFQEVLDLLDRKPELRKINDRFDRNEGLEKSLKNDFTVREDY